jgi:hypothetical protein
MIPNPSPIPSGTASRPRHGERRIPETWKRRSASAIRWIVSGMVSTSVSGAVLGTFLWMAGTAGFAHAVPIRDAEDAEHATIQPGPISVEQYGGPIYDVPEPSDESPPSDRDGRSLSSDADSPEKLEVDPSISEAIVVDPSDLRAVETNDTGPVIRYPAAKPETIVPFAIVETPSEAVASPAPEGEFSFAKASVFILPWLIAIVFALAASRAGE